MADKIITLDNLKRYDSKIKGLIPNIEYCSDSDVKSLFEVQVPSNPSEWSLQDLKSIATDISENGKNSSVYEAAVNAMNNDVKWTVDLTDNTTLTYHIIGIAHDKLSDSNAKAGLTFQATHSLSKAYKMNTTATNAGGWEQSNLRTSLNSGDIWNLFPGHFKNYVMTVDKITDNRKELDTSNVTTTHDKLFILSYIEYFPSLNKLLSSYQYLLNEGSQYDFYLNKITDSNVNNDYFLQLCKTSNSSLPADGYNFSDGTIAMYNRSISTRGKYLFMITKSNGTCSDDMASFKFSVCPAWCF